MKGSNSIVMYHLTGKELLEENLALLVKRMVNC